MPAAVNNVITITTAEQLAALATAVNGGTNYSGVTIKLGNDLDLSGHNWTPIGTDSDHYFSGTFDGGIYDESNNLTGNHTISNLTITDTSNCRGLFGVVGTGGTIKNVTLTDATVSGTGMAVGGVVGANGGTVQNVTVSGTVRGNYFVGGLVGQNPTGTIESCTVSGTVIGTGMGVGGVVGGNSEGGTVSGNTSIATVSGQNNVGGLVGLNGSGGTVSGNNYYGTTAVGNGTGGDNTQLYKLTVPTGVTVSGDSVKIVSGNYYATGSVTLSATNSNAVIRSTNSSYTNNTNGTVSLTVSADTDLSSAFTFYYGVSIPSCVDTVSGGTSITVNNTTYYQNGATLNLTAKTGYVLNSESVTVGSNAPSITATLDSGHYAFKSGDTYALATNDNIASNNYPDLTQVYALTLPEGVTASGDIVATDSNGNYYATGSVTFTGVKTGYVIAGVNVTEDKTVTASLDTTKHYAFKSGDTYTLATADNVGDYPDLTQVYALTLPTGVTVNSGIYVTANGTTYAAGDITFAGVKTGYVIDGVNVTEDKTVTATLDTANHYVFGNATDGYTLATTTNTTNYPDLTQVYALTLPSGTTVTNGTFATVDGTTYATGTVTLSATGYTSTVTVDADNTDFTNIVKFNKPSTAVTVGGSAGDFGEYDGLYSITASQENSTLTGNGKNNTVFIAGGGENILTGGGGNDTFKFESGGGIVTDYGIGSTKDSDGSTLKNPLGTDMLKVDGKVSGVYFDRAASSKKTPTFTAIVTYDSTAVEGDDTQIIVLQNINKKPTKYGSNPVYQTNDAAATTLKIWDTSGSKQAVLSASKLKKLFKDDSELDTLGDLVRAKITYLGDIADGKTPTTNPFEQTTTITPNGNDNG